MSETPQNPGQPDMGGELPPLDPELASWFAAAPRPTMPPEVWSRIEGALAAEPPFAAEPPLAGTNVVDLGERRRRRSRVLPVLAGAAGVVLVGAVVIPTMRAGNAPAPVAEAPAGSGASAAVALPATSGPASDVRTARMPQMVLSTGTQYAPEAMPEQVGSLLSTAGITDAEAVASMSSNEPPSDIASVGSEGFTADAAALADCLMRLGMTPESTPPLIVDRATFDGVDSGVIVAVKSIDASAQMPAMLDVVVVGSQCSDKDVASAQHFEYAVAP